MYLFDCSFAPSFVRRDKALNIFPNRNIYSVDTFFYLPFFLLSYLPSPFNILFLVPTFSRFFLFLLSSCWYFRFCLLFFILSVFLPHLPYKTSVGWWCLWNNRCLPWKQTHVCLVGEACLTVLVFHTITTARRNESQMCQIFTLCVCVCVCVCLCVCVCV